MPFSPINLPEANLSIYTIPKNGGTTLWAWVHFLRTGGDLPPHGSVYDQTWMADGPAQERKMIVRRDPVDRFISGYRNFRDHRGLALGFDDFFQQFPELYRTDGNIRHHFMPQSAFYPDLAVTSCEHVVDFQHFADAKRTLEHLTGQTLPDLQLQRAEFCNFEVQEWQADAIARFYQCDYDAGFGIPDVWRNDLPPE